MKYKRKQIIIHSTSEKVFAFMDDLSKTGMHMSESSMMMMGSKLTLEQLPGPSRGVGATFRWVGKIIGMQIDITETVRKWVENHEKVWETIDSPKIILIGWYRMILKIEPANDNTIASLQIDYTRPSGWFHNVLYFFLSGWYCNCCLGNMLNDTKKHFDNNSLQ